MGLLSLCYSLSDVQIVVWANARIPYLRSRQGVQPLDRFIVGYEAVHPVHVQHYLTKSYRGRDRKDYIRFKISIKAILFGANFCSQPAT